MTWKGIDFQGIVNLDQSLIDELRLYLLEKEVHLGKAILDSIEVIPQPSEPNLYSPSLFTSRSILDSAELFVKSVRTLAKNKQLKKSKDAWRKATNQINISLWEYVEIIEGCITELFQQLAHVSFEEWRPELMAVVDTVNEILLQKIREMYRVIDLLKTSLNEYRSICQAKGGMNPIVKMMDRFSYGKLIDSSLVTSLKLCERILIREKKIFIEKYNGFTNLIRQADESINKFSNYLLLSKLDVSTQNDITRIYRLLKLWKLNEKTQVLSRRDTVRAIRTAYSIEKATELFRIYYHFMKTTLFERSKMLKMGSKELFEAELSKKIVLEIINGYRSEVHTLGALVEQFREYFLASHPDPYVRTRWGFPEWIVGPEPQQTKELHYLVFKLERLDKLYADIGLAIHRGPSNNENIQLSKKYREILSVLHEMGQPLTSRSVMRSRSERIISLLQDMNELGSFNPEVIDYVGKVLSRAMRADWQYHVLFEFSAFHHLFEIHQGLVGTLEGRFHLNRMNKFKNIIKKLQEWVKNRDIHKHVQEIEMEMSDLKLYLQEFLAQVQRTLSDSSNDPDGIRKATFVNSAELLEYRYLFGNFFHFLHQNEPEGKTIRNQFLFVDQYFETVENFIQGNQ